MAVLQIVYLAINIVGVVLSLAFFISDTDCSLVSTVFTFVGNRLGNIPLAIISILLIALFIPTLAFMTAVMAFIMLYGTYAK